MLSRLSESRLKRRSDMQAAWIKFVIRDCKGRFTYKSSDQRLAPPALDHRRRWTYLVTICRPARVSRAGCSPYSLKPLSELPPGGLCIL